MRVKQQTQPTGVVNNQRGNGLGAKGRVGEELNGEVGSPAETAPLPGDQESFGIGIDNDARSNRLVLLEKAHLGMDRYAGTASVFHIASCLGCYPHTS